MQNKIALEPLHRVHLPLLHAWLQEPHVKAFYDKDEVWSEELVHQKFGSYIEGFKWIHGVQKPIYSFIVYFDEQPVGYAQYYNAYDFPRDRYDLGKTFGHAQLEDGRLAALDIFIGAKAMMGKGIGPLAIQKLLKEHIWKQFSACLVDPDPTNKQAIRAYEKAGFHTIFSGKIHLMLCNKTAQIPIFIRTGVYGVATLNHKILVVQQKRGVHQWKWDLPGGGIDPGESIEEALRREFLEEVGMTFSSMTHLSNLTAITDHPQRSFRLHQVGLIYRVDHPTVKDSHNPELQHQWLSLEELKNFPLTPFLHQTLSDIKLKT